ncbi:MAG: hypothetical protein AAF711_04945 [Planctomycetota bacterium]
MPRELIDLGLVARMTETPQHLTSRYVKRHGPDPVGRVGNSPYWNSEDLDSLITAVEVGKARNKDKSLVIVVPDEDDALRSRLFLHRHGENQPLFLSDADPDADRELVKIEILGDAMRVLGLPDQLIDGLREVCDGDEIQVARTMIELMVERTNGLAAEDVAGV